MWGGNECMHVHVRSEDEYCIVWHNIILGITTLQFGRPDECLFPVSQVSIPNAGRSVRAKVSGTLKVCLTAKAARGTTERARSSTTCYHITCTCTDGKKNSPEPEFRVGRETGNKHSLLNALASTRSIMLGIQVPMLIISKFMVHSQL